MSDAGKKILVIEDDPVGQTMLCDYLTAKGYEVHSATNGVQGVEMAQALHPDLVLCDVLLPRKSGFEVCFELKRGFSDHTPLVLMMSAILQDSAEQKYAREGLKADGYFIKPFAMSAMLARVEQLLNA